MLIVSNIKIQYDEKGQYQKVKLLFDQQYRSTCRFQFPTPTMPTDELGLEIPAFGAQAAIHAVDLGASRIELNAKGSYPEGGLTPQSEDLKVLISSGLKVPLRIMIRPRGPPQTSFNASSVAVGAHNRDFIYTDEEFAAMETSIDSLLSTGLLDEVRGDGFVFGILAEGRPGSHSKEPETSDTVNQLPRCRVDKERCTRLVEASRPFKAIFHRAYDEIVSCDSDLSATSARSSWESGLEDLAACGFDGILTSGGLGKAIDNIEMLNKIITKAKPLGIQIIIGGGIRTVNIGELVDTLSLRDRGMSVYTHSACLHVNTTDEIDPDEVRGILRQL
ncbi:hypothetical protein F5Y18DRAFT_381971 [Xylariaceae sp. FL1019]|nr:hypothetical protein F5Y18DRAFT_381971 [Xylariaceae sp. FL1019]